MFLISKFKIQLRCAILLGWSLLFVIPIGWPGSAARTQREAPITPEAFGAVGDGKTDDTVAWHRAAESGRDIVAKASYLISDTIVLAKAGVQVTGGGRLIATRAMRDKPLLHSRADNCLIQGLRLDNPTESQAATGSIGIAIQISAHGCQIVGNVIDSFQNGIVISADGEYFDNVIRSNEVRNIIGAGAGPGDAKSPFGEDRGDGIVSWGSRTQIIDNQVSAKPGTDARIGIHVEGMGVYKRRRPTADDDSGAEIVGNTVRGPFRRGIANEGLSNVRISNNDLPGGYAWWGIAVTQSASNTEVSGNRITFDRTMDNLSGAAWSFWPAAIQIAGFGPDSSIGRVVVRDNVINVTRGGGAGIQYQNAGGRPGRFAPLLAFGNDIRSDAPNTFSAFSLPGETTMVDRGEHNMIKGSWR